MTFRLLPPSSRPTIDKDPDASLRYGIDCASLLHEGDALATVVVSGSAGVTATSPGATGTVAHVRVSGGTAGQVGSVTLRWTTAQGDTDERTLYFHVVER